MVINGTGDNAGRETVSLLDTGSALQAAAGDAVPPEFITSPVGAAYSFVAPTNAPVAATGVEVAALAGDSKWTSIDPASGKTIVTYSFADPHTSVYAYASAATAFPSTLAAFSDADKALTRTVLAHIEAVCGVHFVEVPDNAAECGVLRYAYSQQPNAMGLAGYTFYPSSDPSGGDVWIGANQAQAGWDFFRPDLILHETLHAIGLKHPFAEGTVLPTPENIIPNTVMSYSPLVGSNPGAMSSYPAEPMALDIAALQFLYGTTSTASGDTRYDLAAPDFQSGFRTIWDAGGSDVLDAGGLAHGVALDLHANAHSDIGVSVRASGTVGGIAEATTYTATLTIAAGVVIENAIGTSFADVLIGNDADNWLQGGAGNDLLIGGGGNNILDGGPGIDTASYAAPAASYQLAPTATGRALTSSGTGATDSLLGIERLSFSDGSLALDLNGAAGEAARVLAAVFGPAELADPHAVGTAIRLLDQGLSVPELAQQAIDLALGTQAPEGMVVDLLYTNAVGAPPSVPEHDKYLAWLLDTSYSEGTLTQYAADSPLIAARIDLAGLAAHGLAYV